MARVIYSSIISSLAGSIGSAQFQRCNGVNSLRLKSRPKSQPSTNLQAARAHFANTSLAFNALSSANRNLWIQYFQYFYPFAGKSSNKVINLRAMFLAYHCAIWPQESDILTSPALNVITETDFQFTIELDAGDLYIIFANSLDWNIEGMSVFMSDYNLSSLPLCNTRFKHIYLDKNPASEYDISDSYSNAFGSLPSLSDQLYVRCTLYCPSSPYFTKYKPVFKTVI